MKAYSKKKSTSRKARVSKAVAPYRKKSAFPWRSYALASPPIAGMGLSSTTILRTSFFANVTAAAGTGIFTGYLKPGSCFDPSGDIATMQPHLYDQFAAMYNRYKVNSCKIRIKITGANPASATSFVWVAAAYPAVDSTALTTYQAAASQQYAKTTSGAFASGTSAAGAPEGKYLSFDLKSDAVVGIKADAFDTGALVTADPTTLQFMLLPIFIQSNFTGAAVWTLEVDMWQNVTFSQKKNVVDA